MKICKDIIQAVFQPYIISFIIQDEEEKSDLSTILYFAANNPAFSYAQRNLASSAYDKLHS